MGGVAHLFYALLFVGFIESSCLLGTSEGCLHFEGEQISLCDLSLHNPTLQHEGIVVTVTKDPKPKIHENVKTPSDIAFGKHFSDHMLLCHWSKEQGWEKPRIQPYQDIPMSLSMSALHYATEVCVCTHIRVCVCVCMPMW